MNEIEVQVQGRIEWSGTARGFVVTFSVGPIRPPGDGGPEAMAKARKLAELVHLTLKRRLEDPLNASGNHRVSVQGEEPQGEGS